MQELLRREMGIDAFALDGDATELGESWQDRRRGGPPARDTLAAQERREARMAREALAAWQAA